MKSFRAVLLVSLAGVCSAASDRVVLAAMKLSEESNYSWRSTIEDDVRTYDVHGKTVRGSYTWVRLPMVKAVAERLGREADHELEAFYRGSTKGVIATATGWKFLHELPRRRLDGNHEQAWAALPVRSGRMRGVTLAGLDPWDPVLPLPPMPAVADERPRAYSNAQLGASHPHEELGVIVSSCVQVQVNGDVVTGRLSDLGAQLLLVRDGQEDISPICAAGTFQLQIARGAVVRYALNLEGLLLVERRRVHVHQSSVTVMTHVGTTELVVPDEVRRKLGE